MFAEISKWISRKLFCSRHSQLLALPLDIQCSMAFSSRALSCTFSSTIWPFVSEVHRHIMKTKKSSWLQDCVNITLNFNLEKTPLKQGNENCTVFIWDLIH